jgi:hypothetical protein
MFVEFRFHFPWAKEYAPSYRKKRPRRRLSSRIQNLKLSLPGFVCVAAENGVSLEGSIDYVVYVIPIFGNTGISAHCTATVQASG